MKLAWLNILLCGKQPNELCVCKYRYFLTCIYKRTNKLQALCASLHCCKKYKKTNLTDEKISFLNKH